MAIQNLHFLAITSHYFQFRLPISNSFKKIETKQKKNQDFTKKKHNNPRKEKPFIQ